MELDTELAEADVLVMILPSTADTAGALDAARLSALPARAHVVNVGRGSTVDEAALVAAPAPRFPVLATRPQVEPSTWPGDAVGERCDAGHDWMGQRHRRPAHRGRT